MLCKRAVEVFNKKARWLLGRMLATGQYFSGGFWIVVGSLFVVFWFGLGQGCFGDQIHHGVWSTDVRAILIFRFYTTFPAACYLFHHYLLLTCRANYCEIIWYL